MARATLGIKRPDVGDAYPDIPDACDSGFVARVALLPSVPLEELTIMAVLKDQQRAVIGSLTVGRVWRDTVQDGTSLVSVVIPCYGHAHLLGSAIESVIEQTHPFVEIVVVDDGSPDNTSQVAARYGGVRVVRQENEGLSGARNRGLRETSGDFLVFLDADDRLHPEALEVALSRFVEHPEAAFVAGRTDVIDLDGHYQSEQPPFTGTGLDALLGGAPIWNIAAVMYRRSVFDVVAPFNQQLSEAEDYDLYYRIARDFPIVFHDKLVASYRKHGWNMTEDAGRMLRGNLRALRGQRQRANADRFTAAAYRRGIRYWQQTYGDEVATQALEDLRGARWTSAGGRLLLLARYYPVALATVGRTALASAVDVGRGLIGTVVVRDQEVSAQGAHHETSLVVPRHLEEG